MVGGKNGYSTDGFLKLSTVVLYVAYLSLIFSAHGFKHGPVSGKILAQLAIGETPAYDMSPFRITRFKTSSQPKASL